MKKDKIAIGKRIHDLRTSHNMSMEDLANSLGVAGKSTINEWEKGRSTPNKNNLKRLSDIFNVDSNYIIFGNLNNYLEHKMPELLNTKKGMSLYKVFTNYLIAIDSDDDPEGDLNNLLKKSRGELIGYLHRFNISYSSSDDDLLDKIIEFYKFYTGDYMNFEELATSMLYGIQSIQFLSPKNFKGALTVAKLSGNNHPGTDSSLDEWLSANSNKDDISNLINEFYVYKLSILNAQYFKKIESLIEEEKKEKKKHLK